MWSSYLDANFQKEVRRRHRVVKHKYIEALNRKLSWDRHFPAHPKHLGLKGFMCSAWRGQDPRPGGKWVDVDELFNNKERPRKGTEKGIEDVGQSALEKLLGHRLAMFDLLRAGSPLWVNAWNDKASSESPTKGNASYTSPSALYDEEGFRKRFQSNQDLNTSSDPEYQIDPITNRKVFKKKSNSSPDLDRKPIEIPVKTFKGYRSPFQDRPSPCLPAAIPDNLQEHGKKEKLGLAEPYRVDGTSRNVYDPAQGFEEYDRKVNYKSGQFYDPASISANDLDPVQKGLQDYDSRISSKGTESAISGSADGDKFKKVDPVQEGLREYDGKVDYGSGRFYNCAGKDIDYSDPAQRGLEEYDSKISSEGCVLSKSDVNRSEVIDKDGWEEYDRQVDYKSGQFYEPARTTIDYSDPIQSGLKDYDGKISRQGLENERGVAASERLDPVTEALKEYDEDFPTRRISKKPEERIPQLDPVEEAFHGYDPVHEELKEYETKVMNERSGKKQSDPVRDALKDYDSRTDYGPKGALGIPMKSKGFIRRVRGAVDKFLCDSKGDLDLLRASDVRAGSGIMKTPMKETESEKLAKRKQLESDFNNLQGVEVSSADEVAAAEKVKQSRKLVEDLRIEHSELQNHAAHARNRINAKIAEVEAGWPRSRKMTGNFIRDFPEEFEASWTAKHGSSGGLIPTKKASTLDHEQEVEKRVQEDENAYISGTAPNEAFSNNPGAPRIETSLDRTAVRHAENEASSIDNVEAKIDPAQQGEGDLSVSVSSYGSAKRNETTGETETNPREELKLSKQPKKESDQDLVREVRKIYEEAYGTIDCKHRQADDTDIPSQVPSVSKEHTTIVQVSENVVPTLYKILAYDPTMQSISTAETTSIVPDSSGSLTPAEVLLRLSNPAKFFPHFRPLQSEGYEIVSGSGDVLVFRKVRSGAPQGLSVESKPASSETVQKYISTNPIDGMQSSPVAATGNFASPTGFVNHDLPGVSEPPFKSNIDVRREEPVFSGKRNWEEDDEGTRQKGRGRAKRVLVGAAWVAAASYAVGVVAEFFKTGGIDGKGPQGF
jgi:hypothetical protein